MGKAILKEEDEPEGSVLSPSSPEVLRAAVRLANKGNGNVVSLTGDWSKSRSDFDSDTDWALYQYYKSIHDGLKAEYTEVVPQRTESGAAMDQSIPYYQWLAHACPKRYTSLLKTRPRSRWTNEDYVVVKGVRCLAPKRGKRRRVKLDGKWVYQWVPDLPVTIDIVDEHAVRFYDGTGKSKSPSLRTARNVHRYYEGVNGLRSRYDCDVVWIGEMTTKNVREAQTRYESRRAYSQAVRTKHGKDGYTPPNVGRSLVRRVPGYDIKGVHTRGGYHTIGTGTVEWFCRNPSGCSPFYKDDVPWPHGKVDPNAAGLNAAMHKRAQVVWETVRQSVFDRVWPDRTAAACEPGELTEYAERLKLQAPRLPDLETVYAERFPQSEGSQGGFDWVKAWTDEVVGLADLPANPAPLEGEYLPATVEHDPVPVDFPNLRGRELNTARVLKTVIDRQYASMNSLVEVSPQHPHAVEMLQNLIKKNRQDHSELMAAYLQARVLNGGLARFNDDVNIDGILMDITDEMADMWSEPRPMVFRDLSHVALRLRSPITPWISKRSLAVENSWAAYAKSERYIIKKAKYYRGRPKPNDGFHRHTKRVAESERDWQEQKANERRAVSPWFTGLRAKFSKLKSWLVGESVPKPKPLTRVVSAMAPWFYAKPKVSHYQLPEKVKIEGGDYTSPIRDLLRGSIRAFQSIGPPMYHQDDNSDAEKVQSLPAEEAEAIDEGSVTDLVGPGAYMALDRRTERKPNTQGVAKRIKARRSKRLANAA